MAENHPVLQLWSTHHPPNGYPLGVEAVPEPIPGRAFFPGGWGLFGAERGAPLPPMPVNGIMVLGHDFHSRTGYDESFELGSERPTLPTWNTLLKVLETARIEPETCFFTNLYMGLRSGDKTTGVFPGAADAEFRRHCQDFLLRQIAVQRPRLILTLGVQVPPVIAKLSEQLAPWSEKHGIKHIDRVGAMRMGVAFDGVPGFTTTVAALLHPSLRSASLRHRRYADRAGIEHVGHDAELAILRDALEASA